MARILGETTGEKAVLAMGAMYVEEAGVLEEIYSEVDPQTSSRAVIDKEVAEGFFRLDMGMGDEFKEQVLEILENMWEITDEKSALKALADLRDQGHRAKFAGLLKVANDLQKFRQVYEFDFAGDTSEPIPEEEYVHLSEWIRKANAYVEGVGILAWDMGRFVHVVRLCYLGGMLSDQQCWSELAKVEPLVKGRFKDWMQFAQSYLIGLSFWAGQEDDIMKASCERLMGYELSPWTLYPLSSWT